MQKQSSSSHSRPAEEAEYFSLSRQIKPKAPTHIGFRERKKMMQCHLKAFSSIGGGWIAYGENSMFNEASPEALINATFNQASKQDLIKIIQHLDKLDSDILSRCINARWPLIHNYDCLYKDLPILFPIQQQVWFSDN